MDTKRLNTTIQQKTYTAFTLAEVYTYIHRLYWRQPYLEVNMLLSDS